MGELIALKGTDLDFAGRFIHVQRNLSRGRTSVPKNGRDRKVDMSSMLAATLAELLSSRRSKALQEEMKKPASERRGADAVIDSVMDDWLFLTPIGTQLDPSNLRKVFNRLTRGSVESVFMTCGTPSRLSYCSKANRRPTSKSRWGIPRLT